MNNILIAEGFEDILNIQDLAARRVESISGFGGTLGIDIVDGYLNKALSNRNRTQEREILFEAVEETRTMNVGVRLQFFEDTIRSINAPFEIEYQRIFSISSNTAIALTCFVKKIGEKVFVKIEDSNQTSVIEESAIYTEGWLHLSVQMATGLGALVSLSIDGTKEILSTGDFSTSSLTVNQSSLYLPGVNNGALAFDDFIVSRDPVPIDLVVVPIPFNSIELQDQQDGTFIDLNENEFQEFQATLPKLRGVFEALLCHISYQDTNGTNHPLAVSIDQVLFFRKTEAAVNPTEETFYVNGQLQRNFFDGNTVRFNAGS